MNKLLFTAAILLALLGISVFAADDIGKNSDTAKFLIESRFKTKALELLRDLGRMGEPLKAKLKFDPAELLKTLPNTLNVKCAADAQAVLMKSENKMAETSLKAPKTVWLDCTHYSSFHWYDRTNSTKMDDQWMFLKQALQFSEKLSADTSGIPPEFKDALTEQDKLKKALLHSMLYPAASNHCSYRMTNTQDTELGKAVDVELLIDGQIAFSKPRVFVLGTTQTAIAEKIIQERYYPFETGFEKALRVASANDACWLDLVTRKIDDVKTSTATLGSQAPSDQKVSSQERKTGQDTPITEIPPTLPAIINPAR